MAQIFNVDDLTSPQGKNGLSSFAAYYQKLLYKERIYPSNLWDPLDTWYDKQYYGRVDAVQNSIFPNPNKFKAISSAAKPNILALNFVADAFEALSRHMENAALIGVCVTDGNKTLTKMKAHRAYEDPFGPYGNFLNTAFESFNNKMPRYTPEIRDFPSFTEHFTRYLKEISKYVPITLSNYLLTGTVGLFNTGLCIAIDNAPFDDDKYKYDKYLSDPNYDFYVRAAKAFGFLVDKDAPWLLVADLFSDAAMAYITTYKDQSGVNVDVKSFFDVYYTRAYTVDIEILRMCIINSYNSYIERNPYYQKRTFAKHCDKYSVTNALRVPPDPYGTTITLTPKLLSNLYLELRSTEAENPVDNIETLKNTLSSVYFVAPQPELSGIDNVAFHVNKIFRNYIYSVNYPHLNTKFLNLLKELDNKLPRGTL